MPWSADIEPHNLTIFHVLYRYLAVQSTAKHALAAFGFRKHADKQPNQIVNSMSAMANLLRLTASPFHLKIFELFKHIILK